MVFGVGERLASWSVIACALLGIYVIVVDEVVTVDEPVILEQPKPCTDRDCLQRRMGIWLPEAPIFGDGQPHFAVFYKAIVDDDAFTACRARYELRSYALHIDIRPNHFERTWMIGIFDDGGHFSQKPYAGCVREVVERLMAEHVSPDSLALWRYPNHWARIEIR